jgi:quercetin dioxygenase-like cupin family protein
LRQSSLDGVARSGETISNPVTGEIVTFVHTAAETDGELLVLHDTWTRPGQRAAPHLHPQMEERFRVVSGRAGVVLDGAEHELGPGEGLAVPPGTPHVAWNAADGETRMKLEFRPAGRWEEVVERLFALARAGLTDARGVPEPLALSELLAEFGDEIAPAPPARR